MRSFTHLLSVKPFQNSVFFLAYFRAVHLLDIYDRSIFVVELPFILLELLMLCLLTPDIDHIGEETLSYFHVKRKKGPPMHILH